MSGKMKTIAVIGANKPLESFYRRAYGKYRIIGIATEGGAVCKKYCDKFYPVSFKDMDKVVEVCRQEKIDGITSFSLESALPTIVYVAQKLGLTSNSFECVERTATKYSQREAFKNAGIPVPFYKLAAGIEDFDGVEIPFPAIVKPIDSGGSKGINIVNSREELAEAVNDSVLYSKSGKVIVEEFVDGREFSVEYISYKGQHYNVQITDKVTSEAPHFVELQHHQPADISLTLAQRIMSMVEKALTALCITDSASHTEIKLNSRGELYIIEIGARMGGDHITSDLCLYSTGYDFVSAVAELACGNFIKPSITKPMYSGVYFYSSLQPEVGNIILNNKSEEIVMKEYIEGELREVKANSDRNGFFIYQSFDNSYWRNELTDKVRQVADTQYAK